MRSKKFPLALAAAFGAITILPGGNVAATGSAVDESCGVVARQLVEVAVRDQVSLAMRQRPAPSPRVERKKRSFFDSLLPSREPEPEPEPTASSDSARLSQPSDKPMRARASRPAAKAPSTGSGKSSPRPAEKKDAKAEEGPKRYSRTNTQELSVDEGDIVKTDGRNIYHVSSTRRGAVGGVRNEIRIYQSWPIDRARLLGRFEIPAHVTPYGIEQIYLYDGQIALLTKANRQNGARSDDEMRWLDRAKIVENQNEVAKVIVLDVKDPSDPRMVRELDLDGRFVDARMIGSRLYLATTTAGIRLPPALVRDIQQSVLARGSDANANAIVDEIAKRWQQFANVDLGLPRAREVRAGATSQSIYQCADLRYDAAKAGQNLLNLAHVDLSMRSPITGAGVNGYSTASKVYASEASFYLADPVGSPRPDWRSATTIKKFDLGRGGKPVYVAQGVVRGNLLNQFSMSEYAGRLRVATSDQWMSNNVYVLETDGDQLTTVGNIENLASGERIFAVRMMGAKGYVVTFRRTDPLYTLDLSDPKNPQVIGELKIEGFSNYLHPLDDDHLLAVGQDADSRGRATGFHLQIFDVSDPRHPRRTHHEKLDPGSASATQTDHHAFMFEPSTNTLAMPWKGQNYWGLIAYHVDRDRGFRKLGKVNHALMYKQFFRKQCRANESTECGNKNYWWRFFSAQDLDVDRVVAIDDHLFSLSRSGMMVHRVGKRLRQSGAVLVSEPAWRPTTRSLSYLER